jgi:hypothetical protein
MPWKECHVMDERKAWGHIIECRVCMSGCTITTDCHARPALREKLATGCLSIGPEASLGSDCPDTPSGLARASRRFR